MICCFRCKHSLGAALCSATLLAKLECESALDPFLCWRPTEGVATHSTRSQRSAAALAFVLAGFLAANMALFGFLLWRKRQVT